MNNQVGAFCELIEFLHSSHSSWSRGRLVTAKQRDLNEKVGLRCRKIGDIRLRQLLAEAKSGTAVDLSVAEGLIFLKPPTKEGALLPVVSLRCHFSKDELRIRLALFTFDSSSTPVAIGMRFETPEGAGEHNYYHAQMIRSFEKGTAELPGVPAWLPVTQPALLMSARTPFSLFLGVLVGLYGLNQLERDWRSQRFTQHLKADLELLKVGCGFPVVGAAQ